MEITLNRSHLQEIHDVLRQLADRRSLSPLSDKVLVRAEPGRVSIIATNGDVDVFHQAPAPENQPAGQILVPLATLAELAKGKEAPVQLSGETAAQADIEKYPVIGAGAPKRFHHEAWPAVREHLRNAATVAASARDRYSINNICMTQSSIVSTDGHHLYAGNSMQLPLRKGQEYLIAPPKVFGSKMFTDFEKSIPGGLRERAGGLSALLVWYSPQPTCSRIFSAHKMYRTQGELSGGECVVEGDLGLS